MEYTIGIPRALLYHKYKDLYKMFFENLGCKVIISPHSDKQILQDGINYGIDEMCLSLKLFLGHVKALIGKCDYILVPRISSLEKREELCTNFSALYDLTRNIFPEAPLINYNIDVKKNDNELFAFLDMGKELGFSYLDSMKSYHKAKKYAEKKLDEKIAFQKEKIQTSKKIKILLVAHPYNLYDELIGCKITNLLNNPNIDIIYSDLYDEENVEDESKQISKQSYWTYNKSLMGSVIHYKEKVDGIILLTTFPCGPDSLCNEMCIRKIKDKPLINIIIDELDSLSGLTTRIESFIDILEEKKKRRDYYEYTQNN